MDDLSEALDRDGFVLIPGALDPISLHELLAATDRVYEEERTADRLGADGMLHMFSFVSRDPAFERLLDHPATFPLIWGALGWNIHMYHCHLDVRPPSPPGERRWGWHQDGGRINLEIETCPRPRLALKIAYFLSDASEPGRGNTRVLPGSHLSDSIPRPAPGETDFTDPEGAMPVLAEPGTAMIFDRRLWHSRSDNHSDEVRKALFLAYTYRWIRPRDELQAGKDWLASLPPVRRQLVGASSSVMGYWMPENGDAPLRDMLTEQGLLEPEISWHR
jgi:ectoine hydroxylase-related dioxygenase (phytanoyl-CoA dioxygenase family)